MSLDPKERPGYLTLESPFDFLYDWAGTKPKGRPVDSGKGSNRLDIALYHKNEKLSHVIEVKRDWTSACHGDLGRLKKLYSVFRPKMEIQAVFACALQIHLSKGENSIENWFKKIEDESRDCISDKSNFGIKTSRGTDYYKPMLNDDKTYAFTSFCLSLTG